MLIQEFFPCSFGFKVDSHVLYKVNIPDATVYYKNFIKI